MSEIRFNFVTGDWVIVAPERSKRPEDFTAPNRKEAVPEYVQSCPFCPGNEDKTPPETFRIDHNGTWAVRSTLNKFSALNPDNDIVRHVMGFQKFMTGFGMHEVIIETRQHNMPTALLPVTHVADIIASYRNRFLDFYKQDKIKHVIVFKNHGLRAGTSLQHPHSQIVGTPVIPGQVKGRIEEALKYYDDVGECLYCWYMQEELRERVRIISENRSFVVFIPYAALSPFHIWIFPRRHNGCFGYITDSEVSDLAGVLKDTLLRLYHGLGDPDLNYVIRSLSPQEGAVRYFHWYVTIIARVTRTAGFEMGTGMYINPSLPDNSAKFLRDVGL